MGFLGSTTLYPTVTPAAADLVPLIQDSTGEQKTATVAALTGSASEPVVALTGTSHSILSSYRSKLVTFSNAGAIAVSLPQAGASFPDGWFCDVKNKGAGTVTITPTTSTIDGAATLVLPTGKSCRIVSDGTNYQTAFLPVGIDSDDVTYTPTTPADWDGGVDPGDVEQALDQLAERVTGVEVGGTAGKHAIYIAAASMIPSASGGCAALATIASAANQPDISTLDFDSGSTNEYAQFGIVMPKSWNEGTVTFKYHWSHASGSGDVIFGLQAVAVSNDDAIATNFGTAQEVTDTGGTANDLYTSSESSAITVAGSPAAEDMVFFRVYRNSNSGSDTLGVDARLHGITLYITTDAETDA